MTATKLPDFIGLTGKLEASYNAGGSLSTATDGILLAGPARPTITPAFDGGRRIQSPVTRGNVRRLVPAGSVIDVTIPHEMKGAAAAYAAAVLPSAHVLLRCAGFDSAVDTTAAAETVTYTPTPRTATPASGVFGAYAIGQLWPIQAGYCDLSITGDSEAPPLFEFALKGLLGSAGVTEVTLPAITYPSLTTDPPKNVNIAFTLGDFTGAVVRNWAFKMNRQIGARRNQNTAGAHSGFSPSGGRSPELSVTIEAPAFATTPYHAAAALNPYKLFEAGTEVACSIQIGSVQYNKFSISAGAAQLMGYPEESEDEGAALWTLRLQFNPSAFGLSDDVTLLFD